MATRADQTRAATNVKNSTAKRAAGTKKAAALPKPKRLKAATMESKHGRALHGKTKQQADAKAGKADPGKNWGKFRTGVNGGEEQTINNVAGTGRGADGAASLKKASRKSSRGGVPGGEKPSNMTRAVQRRTVSPEARAARGK